MTSFLIQNNAAVMRIYHFYHLSEQWYALPLPYHETCVVGSCWVRWAYYQYCYYYNQISRKLTGLITITTYSSYRGHILFFVLLRVKGGISWIRSASRYDPIFNSRQYRSKNYTLFPSSRVLVCASLHLPELSSQVSWEVVTASHTPERSS